MKLINKSLEEIQHMISSGAEVNVVLHDPDPESTQTNGIITMVDSNSAYPIRVRSYNGGNYCFGEDGRHHIDGFYITLLGCKPEVCHDDKNKSSEQSEFTRFMILAKQEGLSINQSMDLYTNLQSK